MRVLELFAGTHSVGKVAEERGHEVVSLDLQGSDINIDILKWDYKSAYPEGYFDYIHASFPCETFSWCRKCYYGKPLKVHNPVWAIPTEDKIIFNEEMYYNDQKTVGVPLMMKSLEIIEYFKPSYYTMENPFCGDAKVYMPVDIPYTDITYCKYGFPYKKKTRIWNNLPNYVGRFCKSDCEFMVKTANHKYHLQNCGNQKQTKLTQHLKTIEGIKGGGNHRTERYRIPPLLIGSWFDAME